MFYSKSTSLVQCNAIKTILPLQHVCTWQNIPQLMSLQRNLFYLQSVPQKICNISNWSAALDTNNSLQLPKIWFLQSPPCLAQSPGHKRNRSESRIVLLKCCYSMTHRNGRCNFFFVIGIKIRSVYISIYVPSCEPAQS